MAEYGWAIEKRSPARSEGSPYLLGTSIAEGLDLNARTTCLKFRSFVAASFDLEGYIEMNAAGQFNQLSINVGETILNPNFPKQVFRPTY
ncbi:MAG TPA: hypothetical protein VGK96_24580 [Candidatus Sulfotelmatobacter sp.]